MVDCAVTALPATSCTPLVIATVTVVPGGRGVVGVNVTWLFVELNDTDVGMAVAGVPELSEIVLEFAVIGLIGSLNVTTTNPFNPTFC